MLDTLDTKYAFVVHAELNAILNSGVSLKMQRSMSHCFHVMNVLRPSFKVELQKSSMKMISMLKQMLLRQVKDAKGSWSQLCPINIFS